MKTILGIITMAFFAITANAQICKVTCQAVNGEHVTPNKDLPVYKEFTLEIMLDTVNVFKYSSVNGVIQIKQSELTKYKKEEVKFKFANVADKEKFDQPEEFKKPVRIADLCGKKLLVHSRW